MTLKAFLSSGQRLCTKWSSLPVLMMMFIFILFILLLLSSFSIIVFGVNHHTTNTNSSHIRHDDRHLLLLLQRQRRRGQTIRLTQQEQAFATASLTFEDVKADNINIIKQGCLQSIIPRDDDDYRTRRRRRRRVCNSDDIDDNDTNDNASLDDSSDCRIPDDFVYPEMRIFAQPWESSIFIAWILQIILSELLDVPTTIETGYSSSSSSSQSGLSLYDDDSQNHAWFQFVNQDNVFGGISSKTGSGSDDLEKQALQHAIRYNQDCTLARRNGIDGSSSSSTRGGTSTSSSRYHGDGGGAENHSSTIRQGEEEKQQQQQVVVEYYEPCAHYIPEIWKPSTWMQQQQQQQQKEIMTHSERGKEETTTRLLRLAPNGLVGQQGAWYIPKFTAQRDSTLLHYMGLQGTANRIKLAETFFWPTTWQYYCDYISPTKCLYRNRSSNSNSTTIRYNNNNNGIEKLDYPYRYQSNDDDDNDDDPNIIIVASRPPANAQEGARFFVPGGLYTGYFRRTLQNDCTLHPMTCTGHLTSYPCSWDTIPTLQLFHLNIPLQGNGIEFDADADEHAEDATTTSSSTNMAHGYQISQLKEIWLAANATKSNVIMTWYSPELSLFQEMLGTDAEMVRIALPPATQQCLDHRGGVGGVDGQGGGGANVNNNQCSLAANDDIQTRAGPLGGCDNPANPLQKLWLDASSSSSSTLSSLSSTTAEVTRSPAHDVLKAFHLSNLQLGEIFDYWKRDKEKNGSNNVTTITTTSPRHAICQWAADNIEYLESFIPESYPRVIAQTQQDDDEKDSTVYYSGFMYACIGVGVLAVLVIMITGFNVVDKKDQQVMQSAPLEFLFCILAGSFIVAVGGIVVGGIQPSNASCVAEIWLVNVGFALGFVPLIYKLAAIQYAAKQNAVGKRRVTPKCGGLAEAVILVIVIIMIVLFLWTTYDPPLKTVASYQLTGSLTEDGETIVDVHYYCSSEQVFWKYLQVAWNLLLLLPSAFMGFAATNIPQDFNERAILTALVHCHILFVLLWLISLLLSPIVDETTLTGFRSMIFSIDSIFTMMIYVFPKFVVRDPEQTIVLDKEDSEVPTSSSPSPGFSQSPLGPIARCIACISGVSSCDDHEYQPVDSDDSALESKPEHALVEMTTDNANSPRCINSEGPNDNEELVSQLRVSVQVLEEERRVLRSEVEKKNMAIFMLEEEVGSLMEQLMGHSGSVVQNDTSDDMRSTVGELQEEGRDLRSFFKSQDISLAQLMSEETKLLQKLESQRSVVSPVNDYKEESDAVWILDKDKNAVIKLDTWDTTDEDMETGEI